jgi:ribosomal protein L9
VRKQEPKINAQEQELKKQNENRNEIAHERKNHNNNMRVGVEKLKNMENKFHGSIALNPNVLVDIVS